LTKNELNCKLATLFTEMNKKPFVGSLLEVGFLFCNVSASLSSIKDFSLDLGID
jgi:hypothetical protein